MNYLVCIMIIEIENNIEKSNKLEFGNKQNKV